ncbi:hypothetical protein ABB37_06191 [Leptomonas pyrrhocoris]|uniref:PhoD-like phosphatase metallophosphatase domain-containing protein n=1 Tax=Leptomonas pyrrhocoris TaxID=157538 RepID=A0A0N0DU93_LEPPY|nr:hypothetical protein ABB37_06191 [Leptomonas pyrrhocoris]KPA78591.1 hypothetical protein ABB37_06191 [Leptomonas pyrrhocoris]|eukprot:XP_015657030.1 hypothetical protein ABB37_06191 [Leptomonas pyrrhocoris]
MEWRTSSYVREEPDRFIEVRSSRRRRYRTSVVTCGVAVLAFCALILLFFYISMRTATTLFDAAVTDTAWWTASRNGLELKEALHRQALQNAPPAHALSMHQILFISCNRHDRSQAYWANIAVAAQCELLSRNDRAAAAPCRRLYAGQTPLSLSGDVLAEEKKWLREAAPLTSLADVPLGACGSVYDSPVAAQHRASMLSSVKADDAAARSAALRFPVAPVTAAPLPLDAALWLGDAIYADKRADGEDGQSLFFHHTNTLADVGHFWRVQRDAPEYGAFVSSCVATTTTAASPSNETLPKPSVRVLGAEEADAKRQERKTLPVTTATQAPTRIEVLGHMANTANTLIIPDPPAVVAGPQHNVWGTWDDHDMGKNDGGKEYPYKHVTQRFFLDFLKAPATDPRWTRAGVHEAYTLPFHAVVDDSKRWGRSLENLLNQLYEYAVCVILLDVRSFRDPPNATHVGDMLGAAQWAWFEAQLQRFTTRTADGREPCAVTLIGSGIQFMLDEKPAENWAAFPDARDRLLGLLRIYKAERVALLTGDVHMGELGGDFTEHTIAHVLGYPLLEATSSGLTHSANMLLLPAVLPRFFRTPRRLSLYVEKNFGMVRLSVDLLRLPALRPYFNDTIKPAGPSSGLFRTVEERQAARAVVQRALNVTFTIFSIPQHGQPVHRLNFPLSMLTYADGPAYLDAAVDPYSGDVQIQNAADGTSTPTKATATGAPPGVTTFTLRNGTTVSVVHYPVSTPVPFVTWGSRVAQRYVFTRSSVSESMKWCVLSHVCVSVVCLVLCMGWVLRWVRRRRRQQRQQRRAEGQAPLLSRNTELRGDAINLAPAPQRWWKKLLHRLRKDKNG